MLIHALNKADDPIIHLTRSTVILRRLRAAIQGRAGKAPSHIDLEEWTGVPEGTIKDWFNNKGRPTIDFLIQLLERAPQRARHEMLDASCRALPLLEDSRLQCDQTVISQLKAIIGQRTGIIWVQGVSDEARTFVATALGNTFLSLTERPRRVTGFDVHEPDWFVPVPGVKYLGNSFEAGALREAVRQRWGQLGPGRSQLILLNGIWSSLHELQKEIPALARRHPVIIAETTAPAIPRLKRLGALPQFVISVSKEPVGGNSISLTIQVR